MLNDDLFSITSKYINNTNRHVFLTGRAGTGKTTFLKKVFHSTHKKCVIAAPTGVAAINAGGVTLHSLLQLPFGCFVPAEILSDIQEIAIKISTPATILKEMRFSRIKLSLLRELELLIIDEVSMLRADLLDAIDTILRLVRRNQEPFGGLQIFFVGDLLQLPPVVKDQEWWIISKWYKSPYFFEAKVLKENPPVYIELKKIFRQSDQAFIEILNNFRYNRPSQRDLDMLNKTCQKFDEVKNCKDYIFITTHNRIVDERNNSELKKLESPTFYFEAEVEGDFVVFLIGARFNKPWKLIKNFWFVKSMPKMLSELEKHPEMGLLGYRQHFSPTGVMVIQYWRSFEQLEAYSRNKDAAHFPNWVKFNKRIGSNGDIGIWHESYLVRAGEYECVYNNMPTYGLAKAGTVIPASGRLKSAGERLGHESAPGYPQDAAVRRK